MEAGAGRSVHGSWSPDVCCVCKGAPSQGPSCNGGYNYYSPQDFLWEDGHRVLCSVEENGPWSRSQRTYFQRASGSVVFVNRRFLQWD